MRYLIINDKDDTYYCGSGAWSTEYDDAEQYGTWYSAYRAIELDSSCPGGDVHVIKDI